MDSTKFYEYYNCGIAGILKITCKGPYESEEAAKKEILKLSWNLHDATTLCVFKHQPQYTKNRILEFMHTWKNTGVFICKP